MIPYLTVVRFQLAAEIRATVGERRAIEVNKGVDLGCSKEWVRSQQRLADCIQQGQPIDPSTHPVFPLRDAVIRICQDYRLSTGTTDEALQGIFDKV